MGLWPPTNCPGQRFHQTNRGGHGCSTVGHCSQQTPDARLAGRNGSAAPDVFVFVLVFRSVRWRGELPGPSQMSFELGTF
jgi:hypothetical protein